MKGQKTKEKGDEKRMKKIENLLTRIDESNACKNKKEKRIIKQKSILFSDCGNCWQTTQKHNEIVDKSFKNNQLLKRVLFWRNENDLTNVQENGYALNENKTNEKRGEKSMRKGISVELTNSRIKIKNKLAICMLMVLMMMLMPGVALFENNVRAAEDWSKALVTEWTIPVDADQTNGTTTTDEGGNTITLGSQTTIKLPIPKHANNAYMVDWGDGLAIQTFDSTADFPTHTYKNTEETTYTIKVIGTVNSFGYTDRAIPNSTNTQVNYYTFTQYLTGLKAWGELEATRYGFSKCTKLISTIPSPNENTFKNVTNMYNLFESSGVTGQIPEDLFANAENVTSFGATFSGCRGLTGTIPENLFANTPKVDSFYYVFGSCSGLTGSIPAKLFANTPEVTNLEAVFWGCSGLTGSIPGNLFANVSNATNIQGAFCGCSGLTGQIPEELFKYTPEVTSFRVMFENCTGLTGSIPEKLFENTTKVTNFHWTFYKCKGLTGNIPENLFKNTTEVNSFYGTFRECHGLTGGIPGKLFINATKTTNFTDTFLFCNGLTGSIPENLFETTKNVTSFIRTFGQCSGLTGSIPENLFVNTPNVTDFGSVFTGCSGLTGRIPEKLFEKTTKVISFASTFGGCRGLTGSIPDNLYSNTPLVENFGNTFEGCSGLTGSIPENLFANTPNVTSFIRTFRSCNNLTGNITSQLFASNTAIQTIPTEWVGWTDKDAFWGTFDGCSKIESANIDTLYIGLEMFRGCPELTDITIGNNVQAIGTSAFKLWSPYNANNLLPTTLDTTNPTAIKYDWLGDYRKITDTNALGLEFTIPANADGANGTTLTLPIPANETNDYLVDWGNGTRETFDNTADFPTHTYTNTEETVYEVQISGKVAEFGTYDLAAAPVKNSAETGKYYSFTQYLTELDRWGELGATRYGFAYCENLTGEIPEPTETTFNNVTSMKDMFKNCDGITGDVPSDFFDSMTTEVAVPADLTVSSEEDVYNSTFYECKNITGVNLDTEYVGYQMFYGANSLTDIQIQDNVQAIGAEAFQATAPYSSTNILETRVTTTNEVATAYNWVEANRDAIDGTALITEWTIPVDADQTNGTTTTNASGDTITLGAQTTIKLPIPAHANNNYTVDWGDGSAVETCDSTANFPTHTYENDVETTYEIRIAGTVNSFGYVNNSKPTATNSYKDYYTFTQYLIGLIQWGELEATRYGFSYCQKLNSTIPEPTENSFINVTNMSYLFNNCTILTSNIPENLFINCSNVTAFEGTFMNCENLEGSIPENLFQYATKATNFKDTFDDCKKITGSIPAKLFANNTKAEWFSSTFSNCTGLTGSIPAELFANTPNVTTFFFAFYRCSGLSGEIPANLFEKTTIVSSFTATFYECSGLTGEIPATLFANTANVTNFEGTFIRCTGLTGNIPSNLFEKTTKVTTFDTTFSGCTGLTGGLSSTLFANTPNVTNFNGTFSGCSGLNGELSPELFSKTKAVKDFERTFHGCRNLKGSIPAELFTNTENVTTFESTFEDCSSLTGEIPGQLFAKTQKVTTFYGTFWGCSGLTGALPAELFANTPNVTTFYATFNECSNITGPIPEGLFDKTTKVQYFTGTFRHCKSLTGSIPTQLFSKATVATGFANTFEECNNLTGAVTAELFAKNTSAQYFTRTFYNCYNLESVDINTANIGEEMFYGCNKVTEITIGDNVASFGKDSFEATNPYNAKNLLATKFNTTNTVAKEYDWLSDNRTDEKIFIKQPEDLTVYEQEDAQFNVVMSGDNYNYQWYEVRNEKETKLTEASSKMLKSNIEGQAGATTTKVITIKSTENKTLSFDYMVSSEKEKDLFTITVEDLNGVITAVDRISGKVAWTEYKQECIPNEDGEIIVTLTYSKNESINSGFDYGAIRNLKYSNFGIKESTYQSDNYFTFEPLPMGYEGEEITFTPWIVVEEDGEKVYKPSGDTQAIYTTLQITMKMKQAGLLNFDYKARLASENGAGMFGVLHKTDQIYEEWRTGVDTGWKNYNKVATPQDDGTAKIMLIFTTPNEVDGKDIVAIRNLYVEAGSEEICSFEDDETFTLTGDSWETNSYQGFGTDTLTIPNEMVISSLDGSKYYCEVSDNMGISASRQALLTVKEKYDFDKALVTEWTIPVDADRVAGTTTTNASGDTITLGPQTTIKLPIPKNASNDYKVDWGDGTTDIYDSTADFPTHTYNNTAQTTYTIKVTGTVKHFGYVDLYRPSSTNSYKNYYTFTQYLTGLIQWGETSTNRYGFSYCQNLKGTIPEPSENTFINVTNMQRLFSYCVNLTGSIPKNLFASAKNVTDFRHTFNECENLTGNIPEDLFKNNLKAQRFTQTFRFCTGLTGSIPEDLFVNNTEIWEFYGVFTCCEGLTGSIPAGLFRNTTKVTDMYAAFTGCSGLTGSIPEELFANMPNVIDFLGVFGDCSGLTGSIPEKLFYNNINVKRLSTAFEDCSGLTGSIPVNLFKNTTKVTGISAVFAGCSGLTGSIPEDLFINMPLIENFNQIFVNCKNLTGNIPGNLFKYNTSATEFYETFYNCSGLTESIPSNLFEQNTKVTSFIDTFGKCSGLTGNIPNNLFEKNTEATNFGYTFDGCSGITGNINEELFINNVKANNFNGTFKNCSNIEKAIINTQNIGRQMFYGCNKLIDITIGNNVQSIGESAFYATDPYSIANPLITNLTTTNEVANNYDWTGDNRADSKFIISEPEDVITKENNEVRFTVEASGDNLNYQWYEVVSGDVKKIIEEDTRIFKSNIEGQADTTATSIIKIKTTESRNLSFEYMVSSEKNGDLFTITIEDANGIVTAVDRISGEVGWTYYEKRCVPTEAGEIIITLTYNKNESIDSGGDYGAIRNLKYSEEKEINSTYETDETFFIMNTDEIYGVAEWNFITETVDSEVIFKNGNSNIYQSFAECNILLNIQEEVEISFDYYINTSENTMVGLSIMDKNGQDLLAYSEQTANNIGWTHYSGVFTPGGSEDGIVMVIVNVDEDTTRENILAIRNLKIITKKESISTFVDDTVFTFTNNEWDKISSQGSNTSTLTIPAEFVTLDKNGNQYYCEVSNNMGMLTTRQALLTVERDPAYFDWDKSLITEWTIPVDLDGAGQGTTIKLPILAHANNDFAVDWGDGSEIEIFDNETSFPTHAYKNTEETTYTIKVAGTINQFGYTETSEISEANGNKDYETFAKYVTGLINWGEIEATRYGFSNCTNLAGTIPISLENSFINVTSMENLFYNCTNLGGNIPTGLFKACQKVSTFKNAFKGCQTLVGQIPEDLFVTCLEATSFEGVFSDCKSLRGNIPANLFATNSKVTTFANAFENCTTLSGAIPETLFTNNSNVTSFASTFKGCSNLTETIPANLFETNKLVEDMSNAFNGCSKLSGMVPAKLFILKDKVTNLSGIFEGCSGLTAAEIQISTDNITNMDNMFKNCTGLESVVFGKKFINLNGAEMFTDCSALRAVILLSQPLTEDKVGTISDLTTLGLTSGGIIYVPYDENEAVYEKVCTNISADKIEQLVKANEPNPDHVGLNETYIDKTGYTVAGFDMDETEKYTQYGFYIVTEGEDVDTSEVGSEWIKYILFKK